MSTEPFSGEFLWPAERDTTTDRPRPRRDGPPTIAGVTESFLAAASNGRTRDPSGVRYSAEALDELSAALHGHIAEELGEMPLGALRRWQVQGFVDELAEAGMSPHRLQVVLTALCGLTRYAREQGMLEGDPTTGVRVPAEGDARPRAFTTTDQLAAVPQSGGSPIIPDAALWQLMKVVTVVFILIAIVLAAESI